MTQKLTMTLLADSTLSIFLPVVYTANFEMLGILVYMTGINKHAAKKNCVKYIRKRTVCKIYILNISC